MPFNSLYIAVGAFVFFFLLLIAASSQIGKKVLFCFVFGSHNLIITKKKKKKKKKPKTNIRAIINELVQIEFLRGEPLNFLIGSIQQANFLGWDYFIVGLLAIDKECDGVNFSWF